MSRSSAVLRALAASAIGGGALVSAEAASAQGIMFEREVRAAVLTDYVFRGVQLGEESFKLVGELRFNGLHGGVALIQPFENDDFSNETRAFAGWSPHLEDHGSMLDFELGFTWYGHPDAAPGFNDQSRFEPYAKLFIDAPLMPSISGYYDAELETYTLEGRLTQWIELGGLNGLEFGFDGGLVSPDEADDHAYAQGSIDFVRNFLGGIEGYVGLRGSVSSEDRYFDNITPVGPVYDQRAKAWVAAGFSASF
jgi:hypothetical protein